MIALGAELDQGLGRVVLHRVADASRPDRLAVGLELEVAVGRLAVVGAYGGFTLVFDRVQSSLAVAKSNAGRSRSLPQTLPTPGAAGAVFNGRELYHRITFPVVPSTRTRFFSVKVGAANLPAICKSPCFPVLVDIPHLAPRAPEIRRGGDVLSPPREGILPQDR